jgi:2-dehydropantoate 2-reductase
LQVVIAGAGGVGGVLGARLRESGHDVAFLARGRNLAAIRDIGLELHSPQGSVKLGPQRASDDARALGAADVVIVAVKLYDLVALAPRLAPLLGSRTAVVPLQNGVEAHEILAQALPPANVLKGTVAVKAYLEAPGKVVCVSPSCRVRLGEADNAPSERAARLADALNACNGVDAAVSPDIDAELWRKLVMLASYAAVCCLARATIGRVLDDADARALLVQAAEEGIAVARTRGVVLAEGVDELVFAPARRLPHDSRPSMLEDLEAGRPLELPFLSGALVRYGAAAGVPTPVHAVACRALAMRARGG